MTESDRRAPSKLGRILKTIAWAILIAFAFGFFLGTLLRKELDRPVRLIGHHPTLPASGARIS